MAWNHPDDVPVSLTRRAYCLRSVKISQNAYAAVIADAYEDVRTNVINDLIQTADEVQQTPLTGVRDTLATRAAAELLGLPWEAVASVLDVWAQEAGRIARERQGIRQKEGQQ